MFFGNVAAFSSSQGSVPSGSMDLQFNKTFVTDDRYDDGWSQISYAGNVEETNPGVSGGTWNVVKSDTGTYQEIIGATLGRTSHVRMKIMFSPEISAGSLCFSSIRFESDDARTSLLQAQVLLNGNVQVKFNVTGGVETTQEIVYDLSSYFWIDVSHGATSVTATFYNESGTEVWSTSKAFTLADLEAQARILVTGETGYTNAVYCDQLSFDDAL